MERAVYVSKSPGPGLVGPGCSRLYVGAESCERLLPTSRELGRALSFALSRGLAFTLVTPYVTRYGLGRLGPLLAAVDRAAPGSEVVVNDWGTLDLIEERGLGLRPVLGRLLTRQRRGPRLAKLAGRAPEAMVEALRGLSVTLPAYRRFLADHGISRVELDWPLHGLSVDLAGGEPPLSGSLYTPYAYVSTTRLCLLGGSGRAGPAGRGPCARECRRFSLVRTHPTVPAPVLVRGNAQFVENGALPPEASLAAMGIDRIVAEPEVVA